MKFNASVSKEEQIHASCEMTGKFARFDQTRNSLLSIPRQFQKDCSFKLGVLSRIKGKCELLEQTKSDEKGKI